MAGGQKLREFALVNRIRGEAEYFSVFVVIVIANQVNLTARAAHLTLLFLFIHVGFCTQF